MAKRGVKTLPSGDVLMREMRDAKNQAAVAKKYGVSRTAVCMALKKHRERAAK